MKNNYLETWCSKDLTWKAKRCDIREDKNNATFCHSMSSAIIDWLATYVLDTGNAYAFWQNFTRFVSARVYYFVLSILSARIFVRWVDNQDNKGFTHYLRFNSVRVPSDVNRRALISFSASQPSKHKRVSQPLFPLRLSVLQRNLVNNSEAGRVKVVFSKTVLTDFLCELQLIKTYLDIFTQLLYCKCNLA